MLPPCLNFNVDANILQNNVVCKYFVVKIRLWTNFISNINKISFYNSKLGILSIAFLLV